MFKFLKNIFKNEENNFIGEVDAMNNNQLVCKCKDVTVGDLREAVNSGAKSFEEVQNLTKVSTGCRGCTDHAKSFEEVQNVTKAGTGCGGCVNKVKALVKELL